MMPEQQRGIDQAIIDGKLIDAIRLYRSVSGASLVDAKAYVEARAASLDPGTAAAWGASPPARAMTFDAPNRAGLRLGALGCGLGIVVIVALVAGIVWLLVTTRLFGMFSIVREPYYHALTQRIISDERFRSELGTPIRVDDGGVWCNYIEDTPTMQQANCDVPVRGPRGAGSVHVQVVNHPGSLDADLWLHVGDRTIGSSS
jgi:hypothetical protein